MKEDERNLLHETISFLMSEGRAPADVRWIGNTDAWFDWEAFARLADRTYDSGFGGQEIAEDLLVVGDNWWLERHEYDGSEWWEYKSTPTKPTRHDVPTSLQPGLWSKLEFPKEQPS